eukprot:m.212311 g.212311  ORF g.212311 m.212311 type:complete len:89 (+) comp39772_c0_seq23:1204-1470(+)
MDIGQSTDIGALTLASRNGNMGIVSHLITLGLSVHETDSCGNTPLHWATKAGHADVAEFLWPTELTLTPEIRVIVLRCTWLPKRVTLN